MIKKFTLQLLLLSSCWALPVHAQTLWGWGDNVNGLPGAGDSATRMFTTPNRIGTSTDWKKIVAHGAGVFAINQAGGLWTWGYDENGNLGIGSHGNGTVHTLRSTTPQQIGQGRYWTNVFGDWSSTYAVDLQGQLWAWGYNGSGKLGIGQAGWQAYLVDTPTMVLLPHGAKNMVSSIEGLAYAIDVHGHLWGWGDNQTNYLGIGGTPNEITEPALVDSARQWLKVVIGQHCTYAITTGNELWVWGSDTYSTTGTGTSNGSYRTPVRIGTAANWTDVATNLETTYAMNANGELYSWGSNARGALGQGTSNTLYKALVPTRIGTANNWRKMFVTGRKGVAYAINDKGELWGWGSNVNADLGIGAAGGNMDVYQPTQIGTDTDWAWVSGGDAGLTVAGKMNKALYAWGWNSGGEVGDGTTQKRSEPVRVLLNGQGAYADTVISSGYPSYKAYAMGLNLTNTPSLGATTVTAKEKTAMLVYPNPAGASFTIRCAVQAVSAICIYNMAGTMMAQLPWQGHQSGLQVVHTHNWLPGFYSIRLVNDMQESVAATMVVIQ